MARDQTGKQPYAIAAKDPLSLWNCGVMGVLAGPDHAGKGANFCRADDANDLVGRIHDRMPAILNPAGYERWLGLEPDPRDLLVPFPSELMTIRPISRRVNSPDNDDERLLEEISPAAEIAV
jgi:putative SOS response-associated peptidase YedK